MSYAQKTRLIFAAGLFLIACAISLSDFGSTGSWIAGYLTGMSATIFWFSDR